MEENKGIPTYWDFMHEPHEFEDFGVDYLLACLGVGKENATSRKALVLEMEISDRRVRKLIEKARDNGCFICNSQDGRGYYIPADLDELAAQYGQDYARAMAILKRLKYERRILKASGRSVK